jgi:uncharacterized protein RhaS with RHS repeats
MRNRWYDPQTGRFLSQDPIGLAGGVNLYAYAGNNPASYSDPFGLKIEYKGTKEEVRYLRAAVADAKRLLGIAAKAGNRLASQVLRGIKRMESDKNRVTVLQVGHGTGSETSPDGGTVTIDYEEGAHQPGGFYPTITVTHELGHSYALLGYEIGFYSKSSLNAIQWGNALRQAVGSKCMQPDAHDITFHFPDAEGNCFPKPSGH